MKTKFHVFTNLAISIDGKISTRDRELFSLGSARDHFYMDVPCQSPRRPYGCRDPKSF